MRQEVGEELSSLMDQEQSNRYDCVSLSREKEQDGNSQCIHHIYHIRIYTPHVPLQFYVLYKVYMHTLHLMMHYHGSVQKPKLLL